MTAADNAHLGDVASAIAARCRSKELDLIFRRAAEYRTPTATGSEIRSSSTSDPTGSTATSNIDGRPDPMTTLHGELVVARRQAIHALNRMLTLADQAVAVETAERVRGGDGQSVDDINRRDGYCACCGSPRYHHGTNHDRLRLLHGTLLACDACRKRWERTTPQTDGAWQEFLEDAKRRGLAARGSIDDVDVAS